MDNGAMKNICIVVGARPNFVKVAPLLRAIQRTESASFQLVYAGREDDPTLEPSLFEDLQMPRPDCYLGADSLRLNEVTAQVMGAFDSYLDAHEADVVVVVDDLASTMAAAITAKKRGRRLAHLVAGTRSFDISMPKEINRLVIDALSDYLFTAGVRSNSVATREQQTDLSQTFMVGNILMDQLRFCRDRLRRPAMEVKEGEYLLLTLNRRVLLGNETRLASLLQVLNKENTAGMKVIAPLRGEASSVVKGLVGEDSALQIVSPLSYLEFGWLSAHAAGVITDSGNVSEEATWNGVPCITLNSYTEHIETVSVGTNVLVGEDPVRLSEELRRMVSGQWKEAALPDRWDGRSAERIVQVLIGK